MKNFEKYKRFETIELKDRTWPVKEITKAPIWCSVDLRDGNQALITPMNIDQKVRFFKKLVEVGFKEIEVGFPSASQIEFDFLRKLIDDNLVPEDVTLQVLTQAREHLIRRTFEAVKGLPRVILHIYNSTSVLQRKVVFGKDKEEIKQIAIDGVKLVRELEGEFDGEVRLEYSPESFTGTEMDYAAEICNAVLDTWGASKDRKVIINLPSTVEMDTPNVYADQIEYMCRSFKDRDSVIVSLHPHNDRGTGVAACELGLMAGADRVEGTLFGNGERTGNLDVVVVGLNMYTHGVDPKLDFTNINALKEIYEDVTCMTIPDRQPYVGKLVFTAFSGSHQDAINKGMRAYKDSKEKTWEVPYLPIDPDDLGRKYEPLVRINSQSGRGGIAFVLEQTYGYRLPKGLQGDFMTVVKRETEKKGELEPSELKELFLKTYNDKSGDLQYVSQKVLDTEEQFKRTLTFTYKGKEETTVGDGDGPISAIVDAINQSGHFSIDIVDYSQHSVENGSKAEAISYVELKNLKTDKTYYGVGISQSVVRSTIYAIFNAINRF